MKRLAADLIGVALALALMPSLASAWQCGWKYSVVKCSETAITPEVSQLYGQNEPYAQGWQECQAALYQRTHRADGSVRKNVFVLADCDPARCPEVQGYGLVADVSYEDGASARVSNRFFINQATCEVVLDRLMSIEEAHEGIEVDVLDACTPN